MKCIYCKYIKYNGWEWTCSANQDCGTVIFNPTDELLLCENYEKIDKDLDIL